MARCKPEELTGAATNLLELCDQVNRLQHFVLKNELDNAGRYLATLRPETQAAIKNKLSPSMVRALEERSGGK